MNDLMAQLETAVTRFPGRWSVVRQESYDGSVVLMVMPEDEACASFCVDAAEGGIGLSVLREDALLSCGRFETMAGAVAALGDLAEAELSRGSDRRRRT